MKNVADYSQYRCPYDHILNDCGHELKGPEGYENTYGVWCDCGFRGPVFCLDPKALGLVKKATITLQQFEAQYAHNSGVTVEWLHDQGQYGRPCNCGDDDCSGWTM